MTKAVVSFGTLAIAFLIGAGVTLAQVTSPSPTPTPSPSPSPTASPSVPSGAPSTGAAE